MKLALIISAIIASVQSVPVTNSFRDIRAPVKSNSSNITNTTTSTIYTMTTVIPISDTTLPMTTVILTNGTTPPITSNMTTNNTTPGTTKTVITTKKPSTVPAITTMMPYKNISCFNNEYSVKNINATIIKNNLITMINNMGEYTKEFSNDISNDELICGTEIAYNNTDNTYNVQYGAFRKSYCENNKTNSDIICTNNTICNKTISCCQDSLPSIDQNCNLFIINQVNDTKNSCKTSNSSECYSLSDFNMPTSATTQGNAGNMISSLKLYLLILMSVVSPAININ